MPSRVRCASAASTSACMPLDHLGHALGLGARGLLAQQRLALGLAAQPLGDVRDEARDEHLAADVDLRHRGLTREAACRRGARSSTS